MYVANAKLPGNGLSGAVMVAGQEHGRNMEPFKRCNHLSRFISYGIGERCVADHFLIDGNINNRVALTEMCLNRGFSFFRHCRAVFSKELPAAGQYGMTINGGTDASARQHFKSFTRINVGSDIALKAPHYRFAERMFGELFCSSADRIQIIRSEIWRNRLNMHHFGRSVSERPGFIKSDLGHCSQTFKRVAFTDEKAVFRCVPNGSHDGRRRRQDQCARAKKRRESSPRG